MQPIDLEVIAKIDQARTQLGVNLRVPGRWTGLLRRSTIGRAIRGSNSIEGYRVSRDEAVAVAAGGEISSATEETWRAIAGYRVALTYVLELATDPHFTYSAELLRSLHYMMLQHDLSKNPGLWRPGPIYVIDEERNERVYEGPDAELVPGLMTELIDDLRGNDTSAPNIVRAAMAHLNFVMIHPFRDGNGRMGRCLQTLVLSRAGTPEPVFSSIEEYLGEHQRPYYDVLALVGQGRWNPGNDAHPWVRFCLRAHFVQAQTFLRRTREMARLYDAVEREVQHRRIPDRMVLAVVDAANGFRVRNSTYRTAADITEQLASNDLGVLVREGLLEPKGAKRGRYYVASPLVMEMRKASREDGQVGDPYATIQLRGTTFSGIAATIPPAELNLSFPLGASTTGRQPPVAPPPAAPPE